MLGYLTAVKCLMLPMGLDKKLTGTKELECCAAAAAMLEADGLPWSPNGTMEALATLKCKSKSVVWGNIAKALHKSYGAGRSLSPSKAIYYLAMTAARMEDEAAAALWGGRE